MCNSVHTQLLTKYFQVHKDETYALVFAPHFNKTIVATGSLDNTVTLTNLCSTFQIKGSDFSQ